jgi:hypothetical protein
MTLFTHGVSPLIVVIASYRSLPLEKALYQDHRDACRSSRASDVGNKGRVAASRSSK